jgi:hypothetical protein
MSLRYSFRHLFFGGKLNKRRLYQLLEDLDASNGGDEKDISSLKTTVGDSTKGLVKAVDDLETTVGDADSGLVHDVAALHNYDDSDIRDYISEIITANSLTDPRETQGDG